MVTVVLREFCAIKLTIYFPDPPAKAIYIPGFNTRVFYQEPIGWEWGIVFGMTVIFIVGCELWKLMRPALLKKWLYIPPTVANSTA